jgi:hypothetical protein
MTKDPHPALAHPRPAIDPRLVFACGVVAIVAALVILILIPKPEQPQLRIFSVLAGLGGASFTSGFTGLPEIETKWLKAGGPLAVFVFIIDAKKPELVPFAAVAIVIAIIFPIICSTLIIILLRWFRAREQVIKATAMIVFFSFMILGVLTAALSHRYR